MAGFTRSPCCGWSWRSTVLVAMLAYSSIAEIGENVAIPPRDSAVKEEHRQSGVSISSFTGFAGPSRQRPRLFEAAPLASSVSTPAGIVIVNPQGQRGEPPGKLLASHSIAPGVFFHTPMASAA